MADNAPKYGFRPYKAKTHSPSLRQPRHVATAYGAVVDPNASGTASVDVGLSVGDPVRLVADGSFSLAVAATTGAPVAARGIIVGFDGVWDGDIKRFKDYVPHGHAWGTIWERAPKVQWLAVEDYIWEIDVDDIVTATTEATYRALIGMNANHVCTGDVTDTGKPLARPRLDISTIATTATLFWRVVGVSPTSENRYFDGANVKLLVEANVSQTPGMAATPGAGV